MSIKSTTTRPVSYTHLDVYKRQALIRIIKDGTIYWGKDNSLMIDNDTVSYTHLERFRRQSA